MDLDQPVTKKSVSLDRKGFDMFVARAILEWNTPSRILYQLKWAPTTNLEHAMIVFRRMCQVGDPWALFEPNLSYSKLDNTKWCCSMRSIGGHVCRVDDADMGLAICLAAATMKGYEIHLDDYEPQPHMRITVLEAYGDYLKECAAVVEKTDAAIQSYDELCGRCSRWLSDNGENVTQQEMVICFHDPLLLNLQVVRRVLNKRKREDR